MRVAVLGAAGFLGLNLVERLVTAGVMPRCVRRRRTNVLRLRSLGVPLVEAELSDVEALTAALKGVDVVFHSAGHYPRFSNDRQGAIATGILEIENVLEAASRAGVDRLVYVSSTATVAPALGRPSGEQDVYANAPGFGVYHDLKWRMEAIALAEQRFQVVVACPSACLGPWDLRVGTSALIVAMARGLAPRYPEGIVSLVDVRDVAEGLVRAAALVKPPKRILISAESRAMSELIGLLAERYQVGRSQPLLPDEARRFADEAEARARAGGGRATLAREIVDLVVHGPTIDAGRSRASLGLVYRPLAETLRAFERWAARLNLIPEPAGSYKEQLE